MGLLLGSPAISVSIAQAHGRESAAYGTEPAADAEAKPKAKPNPNAKPKARKRKASQPRRAVADASGERAAVDAVRAPDLRAPTVLELHGGADGRAKPRPPSALAGWGHSLSTPRFADPRRRLPKAERPLDFGHTLRPGEHFRFDVTFAGNPAGLAEAEIVAVEQDPRGGPPAGAPMVRIEGHARTSGIVSLLATVTDDIVTFVDARTGAAISSRNVLHYSGWAPRKYKHRVTEHAYEGRGQVRIVDTKDGKPKKKLKRAPPDTYDPMSAMAWVRALRLEEGESASAHVVDGTTLMRIEIESRGRATLSDMPSIGTAMGLGKGDTIRIDGLITRVDEYDQPVPGKRVFKLRAWLSADDRRVPLVMESDMWVGAIRLQLSAYDPPVDRSPRRPSGAGPAAASAASAPATSPTSSP